MKISARHAKALLVAAAALALLVACGGSTTSNSGSTPTTGGAGSPATSATVTGNAVTATETEYQISLAPATLTPGTWTFNIENKGSMPHNLNIKGPGVSGQASPTIDAGGSAKLTVTLHQGSYELWCSVDSHKDRGMDMTIQVG